jgi:hypothetical protein
VGYRFGISSIGHSVPVFTNTNERIVVLSCFGDTANLEANAGTLGVGEKFILNNI